MQALAPAGEKALDEAAGRDGIDGVDELKGPLDLAISPDGAHLYVAAWLDFAVVTFARDGATGALTFLAATGVFVQSLALSPDGRRLYAGGDDMRVFARDPATGLLERLGGPAEPYGLDDWIDPTPSPDGRHVYAGSGYGWSLGLLQVVGVGCGSAPVTGCRTPTRAGASFLRMTSFLYPKKDKITWKWKGAATPAAALGDPTTSTDWALCLYDAPATPDPLLQLHVNVGAGNLCAGRPCWKVNAKGAASFRDKFRVRGGLKNLKITPGLDGRAKVTMSVRETHAAPLRLEDLRPPVTMQLVNSEGECWEASFSDPLIQTSQEYKAKSD